VGQGGSRGSLVRASGGEMVGGGARRRESLPLGLQQIIPPTGKRRDSICKLLEDLGHSLDNPPPDEVHTPFVQRNSFCSHMINIAQELDNQQKYLGSAGLDGDSRSYLTSQRRSSMSELAWYLSDMVDEGESTLFQDQFTNSSGYNVGSRALASLGGGALGGSGLEGVGVENQTEGAVVPLPRSSRRVSFKHISSYDDDDDGEGEGGGGVHGSVKRPAAELSPEEGQPGLGQGQGEATGGADCYLPPVAKRSRSVRLAGVMDKGPAPAPVTVESAAGAVAPAPAPGGSKARRRAIATGQEHGHGPDKGDDDGPARRPSSIAHEFLIRAVEENLGLAAGANMEAKKRPSIMQALTCLASGIGNVGTEDITGDEAEG
ncbi:unnamed protein product, partial [Discosporangium mesarthrocarpum]